LKIRKGGKQFPPLFLLSFAIFSSLPQVYKTRFKRFSSPRRYSGFNSEEQFYKPD
jgi:hypothetical protein